VWITDSSQDTVANGTARRTV